MPNCSLGKKGMDFQDYLICWWLASVITVIGSDKAGPSAENVLDSTPDSSAQEGKVDEEIGTEKQPDKYKSGSICVYCKYCQVWIIIVLISINHLLFAAAPTSPYS